MTDDELRILETRARVLNAPVNTGQAVVDGVLMMKGLDEFGPLPANFGQADCQCMHCRQNRSQGGRSR